MIEPAVEHRAFVTVRHPRGTASRDVEAILEQLERHHGEMGPVGCGGTRQAAVFVLSADAGSPAEAVALMVDALSDAIKIAGVDGAYPALVELEAVAGQRIAASA